MLNCYISDNVFLINVPIVPIVNVIVTGSLLFQIMVYYCLWLFLDILYTQYSKVVNVLYVSMPCSADTATRQIEQCAIDIKRWMTSHQLLLNETKTETIVFYAPNAKVPPGITGVDVCGCRITPQPTVREIDIFLDSRIDMTMQVTRTCQAASFQLHNIAKIRHCLTIAACKTIVHSLVTSKLDYGNAVLFGINGRLPQKLQRVQNSAARVITQQRRRDHLHTTPVLIALHWLPVPWRITYKILVLTFRALHNAGIHR